MSARNDDCCAVRTLSTRNTQQQHPETQPDAQQARNNAPASPSVLDLARNRTRSTRATRAKNTRNNQPQNDRDLPGIVAPVRCPECRHFTPNPNNPDQGLGSCAVSAADRMPWPALERACSRFQITRAALDQLASEISSDPARFAAGVWTDGDYDRPEHIRRLAEEIEQRGYPTEWRTDP